MRVLFGVAKTCCMNLGFEPAWLRRGHSLRWNLLAQASRGSEAGWRPGGPYVCNANSTTQPNGLPTLYWT